jgi:hypothetical protein
LEVEIIDIQLPLKAKDVHLAIKLKSEEAKGNFRLKIKMESLALLEVALNYH